MVKRRKILVADGVQAVRAVLGHREAGCIDAEGGIVSGGIVDGASANNGGANTAANKEYNPDYDRVKGTGNAAIAAADPKTVATAVRYLLEELAAVAPGGVIEVRVPPYGAAQCGAGDGHDAQHTRGTPPNIVEMSPETWISLAAGRIAWEDALPEISVSGTRASLAWFLPLYRDAHSDMHGDAHSNAPDATGATPEPDATDAP